MAKDPAFLFYPNDYIGGTMGMTFEEKGAYIELLMLQFNRGHMTSHMIGQTVGQLGGQIMDKFKVDEQGLYFNQRLDDEIKKRQSYTDSRRNNKLGTNQHTKEVGHMTSHMTGHMEDVNRNVNKDVTESKEGVVRGRGSIPPTLEEVTVYCSERQKGVNPQQWMDHYTSNGWLVGKNKMKDWQSAVRTWEHSEINKPKKTGQTITERMRDL